MNVIIRWIIISLAIIIAAYLLPGVTVSGFVVALVTALALGLINAFLRPALLFFTLPLNIATLGLFTFVVNALLIMLVSALVPGFQVENFWWALAFSFVLSLVHSIFSTITPEEKGAL